jgi:hypothetical protein
MSKDEYIAGGGVKCVVFCVCPLTAHIREILEITLHYREDNFKRGEITGIECPHGLYLPNKNFHKEES